MMHSSPFLALASRTVDNQPDYTPMFGILGLFLVLAVCLFLFIRSSKSRRATYAEEEKKQQKIVQGGLASGLLSENPLTGEVSRTCVTCKGIATEYSPHSNTSWMDHIPGSTLINRLFSLPPRYVIKDNLIDGIQLCVSHKHLAVKHLEQFHAVLRAERAHFNAKQEGAVAAMDNGGLFLQLVQIHQNTQETQRAVKASIDAARHSEPQLTAGDSVVIMTAEADDPLDFSEEVKEVPDTTPIKDEDSLISMEV